MVTKDSAAEKAGIHPNDTILQVEGDVIVDQQTLIDTLQTYRIGEKVKIKVERNGKQLEIAATLGQRPRDQLRGGNRGEMQNKMGSVLSDAEPGFRDSFKPMRSSSRTIAALRS